MPHVYISLYVITIAYKRYIPQLSNIPRLHFTNTTASAIAVRQSYKSNSAVLLKKDARTDSGPMAERRLLVSRSVLIKNRLHA